MAASRRDARERIRGGARHDDAPIPLLEELADRYPHTRTAPEALYAIAFLHLGAGAHGPAVAAMRRLGERYPDSGRGAPAREIEASLVRPEVALEPRPVFPTGEPVVLRMHHRNTPRVAFTARRLNLDRLFADAAGGFAGTTPASSRPAAGMGLADLSGLLDPDPAVSTGSDPYLTGPALTWEVDPVPAQPEPHGPVVTDVPCPVPGAGLYRIEARVPGGSALAATLAAEFTTHQAHSRPEGFRGAQSDFMTRTGLDGERQRGHNDHGQVWCRASLYKSDPGSFSVWRRQSRA